MNKTKTSSINELIIKYKIKGEQNDSMVLYDNKTLTFCHIISDIMTDSIITNKNDIDEGQDDNIKPNILIPRRIVFVIDRSGSMMEDKWKKTIFATITALQQLRKSYDRFCILLFNEFIEMVNDMLLANITNINESIACLQNAKPFGATNINDALLTAIDLIEKDIKLSTNENCNFFMNQIIFITDGTPNRGERDTKQIISNVKNINNAKISIFSFGVGSNDNNSRWTKDLNHSFLKLLSLNNNGFYKRIKETNTDIVLSEYFDILSKPVLSNIDIKYKNKYIKQLTKTHFNTIYHSGNDIIVCGKIDNEQIKNLNEINLDLTITAMTGKEINKITKPIEICKEIKININPETNDDNIGRIWAYLQLQQFAEKKLIFNDIIEVTDDEKDEHESLPLSLAMKYKFITPWTSMIVVKKKDVIPMEKPKQSLPVNIDAAPLPKTAAKDRIKEILKRRPSKDVLKQKGIYKSHKEVKMEQQNKDKYGEMALQNLIDKQVRAEKKLLLKSKNFETTDHTNYDEKHEQQVYKKLVRSDKLRKKAARTKANVHFRELAEALPQWRQNEFDPATAPEMPSIGLVKAKVKRKNFEIPTRNAVVEKYKHKLYDRSHRNATRICRHKSLYLAQTRYKCAHCDIIIQDVANLSGGTNVNEEANIHCHRCYATPHDKEINNLSLQWLPVNTKSNKCQFCHPGACLIIYTGHDKEREQLKKISSKAFRTTDDLNPNIHSKLIDGLNNNNNKKGDQLYDKSFWDEILSSDSTESADDTKHTIHTKQNVSEQMQVLFPLTDQQLVTISNEWILKALMDDMIRFHVTIAMDDSSNFMATKHKQKHEMIVIGYMHQQIIKMAIPTSIIRLIFEFFFEEITGILTMRIPQNISIADPLYKLEQRLGVLMTLDEIQMIRNNIIAQNMKNIDDDDINIKDMDILKMNDRDFFNNMMHVVGTGIKFIKHKKHGMYDERYLVIHNDRLYWKKQQNDRNHRPRSINFAKIIQIMNGKNTKALKHESLNDIPSNCCFSIITKKATLDLSQPKKQPVEVRIFTAYLQGFQRHIISSLGNKEKQDVFGMDSYQNENRFDHEMIVLFTLNNDQLGLVQNKYHFEMLIDDMGCFNFGIEVNENILKLKIPAGHSIINGIYKLEKRFGVLTVKKI